MMRRAFLAMAAVGGVLAHAHAQTHVVKKPETVVRAVAVYEWTGDESKPAASRLVPVTLFIDNHLEDAGVYLARPVPFVLQTGNIFELEHAGVPDGTLQLSFARHLIAGADQFDDGWMGFGAFNPLPKPKLVAEKKSGPLSKIEISGVKSGSGPKFSNKTSTDDDDSDRPTMVRLPGSSTESSTTTKSTTPASTTTSDDDSGRPTMRRRTDSTADTSAGTATTPDDPDRPTHTRRSGSETSDSTPSPSDQTAKTPDTTADPNDEADRPTLKKRNEAQRQAARKSHDTSSVGSVGDLNDDPDRPSLHRGKPPGALGEDDLPALVGLPAGMHQSAAVSDAVNRPQHNFARPWTDDAERTAVQQKLQAMARAKLAAYSAVNAQAPSQPPAGTASKATPAAHTAARRKPAPAPAMPATLKDETFKAYTLSYGGDPTYFYSASSTGPDGVDRYVAVVAQQEPMAGDLKLALSSVTDARHLDRTPRFRLVDAVDVEASNRASLLVELRAQNSRQFALYRVIGAQAQQTFLSGSTE
jgi:hypothetical protein